MLDSSTHPRLAAITYVPRVRNLPAGTNPEAAFLRLYGKKPSAFWLDSSLIVPGLSRWSFMGDPSGPGGYVVRFSAERQEVSFLAPDGQVEDVIPQNIFEFLSRSRQARRIIQVSNLSDMPFTGGHVGYFGYELKSLTCGVSSPPSTVPDATFIFCARYLAFDHKTSRCSLVALCPEGVQEEEIAADQWLEATTSELAQLGEVPSIVPTGAQSGPLCFELRQGRQAYLSNIQRCLDEIRAGETYEVCLTNEISARVDVDPLDLYRTLRLRNPAPYSAFFRLGDISIACSSPERFLTVGQDLVAETKPIKGTAPRSEDADQDARIAEDLRLDEKSRSENLMIVDLMRNDFGRICKTGSISVPSLMHIESYKTVHQLVSVIRGELASSEDVIPCIAACFPGGSMTGAPKIRTLQLIDQMEQAPRGIYSGAIGYLSLSGTVDLNIVIRTIVSRAGVHSIGCGGAIVALSDPEEEFEEILLKSRAPIQAIVQAATGDPDHPIVLDGVEQEDVRICAATEADADIVAERVECLLTELGGPGPQFDVRKAAAAIRKMTLDPGLGFALVVEDKRGSRLIGIALVSEVTAARASGSYGILQELWIDPARRSSRLGERLIDAVAEQARSRGWPMLEVTLPPNGHPAGDRVARFYEKCGYAPSGTRRRRRLS